MSMISVIVPVYNTEIYLEECIESILTQTYKDFELLLINDGSTDGSLAILRKYATKDDRIRIFDKKNGGQSQARNMGLDNAKGEYIAFVDSDDIIAANYLEVLFTALLDTKVKMVQSKIARFYDVPTFDSHIGFVNAVEFSKCYESTKYVQCYNDSVSCKLFHKSLFENLRFIEGEIFEDGKIIIDLWLRSVVQTNVDYCGYYYRFTPNSTMSTFNVKKDFEQIIVWEKRIDIYIKLGYHNHIQEINARIFKVLISQYYKAKSKNAPKQDLKMLKNYIKKYWSVLKGNCFIGRKNMLLINCKIPLDLFMFLYKKIYKL